MNKFPIDLVSFGNSSNSSSSLSDNEKFKLLFVRFGTRIKRIRFILRLSLAGFYRSNKIISFHFGEFDIIKKIEKISVIIIIVFCIKKIIMIATNIQHRDFNILIIILLTVEYIDTIIPNHWSIIYNRQII